MQQIWYSFCFHHNFLPNAYINLIFLQVIYNFPNLLVDIQFGNVSKSVFAIFGQAINIILTIFQK